MDDATSVSITQIVSERDGSESTAVIVRFNNRRNDVFVELDRVTPTQAVEIIRRFIDAGLV